MPLWLLHNYGTLPLLPCYYDFSPSNAEWPCFSNPPAYDAGFLLLSVLHGKWQLVDIIAFGISSFHIRKE